jgi:hypothetical protein
MFFILGALVAIISNCVRIEQNSIAHDTDTIDTLRVKTAIIIGDESRRHIKMGVTDTSSIIGLISENETGPRIGLMIEDDRAGILVMDNAQNPLNSIVIMAESFRSRIMMVDDKGVKEIGTNN